MEERQPEHYPTDMQPHQFAGSMVGFLTASGETETPATAISAEVDIVFRASGSQLRIASQADDGVTLIELPAPLASQLLGGLLTAAVQGDEEQQ